MKKQDIITLHPENPHYFQWKGEPTVLVTSSEHYGALINPDFDFEKYLRTLHELGFNNTRVFLGDYVEGPHDFCIEANTLAPVPGRFICPWARSEVPGFPLGGNKFDLDRWDPNYFDRLHRFFSLASSLGIVVETLFFFVGPNWAQLPLNPANNVNGTAAIAAEEYLTLHNGNILARQEDYVRKLVSELQSYGNLIFNISMEPWFLNAEHPGFVSPPSQETKAWIQRVSEWIHGEDKGISGHKHLISVDYSNRGSCIPSGELNTFFKNISVFNTHYDKYAELVRINYDHPKAFAYNENGFFDPYHSEEYRVQGWRFLFSGGALYNNLDYTYQVGAEDGTGMAKFSCPDYVGCGNPEIKVQLRHLLSFMNSIPFIKMQPDREVIAVGDFEEDVWPLVWSGREYAFYVERGHRCRLLLNIPPGNYRIRWLDPATGEIVSQEETDNREKQMKVVSPLYLRDILLHITSADNRSVVPDK